MPDQRLDQLETALKKAQDSDGLTHKPKPVIKASSDNSSLAFGMRVGTEFIVSVTAPAVLGYFLDSWLGTKPFLMLLLLFLGIGAGFMSIYKITQNMGSSVGFSKPTKDLQNQGETAKSSQLSNLKETEDNDDP